MTYYSKDQLIEMAKARMVILDSQKKALEAVATLISNHMRRLTALDHGVDPLLLPRNSMLLLASTGSGKSYLISRLAEIAGLPFTSISAAHLTGEGYKGINLSQAMLDAYEACTNRNGFCDGIVLFDEFDKVRYDGSLGNCQADFLTMIEGRGITADGRGHELKTINTNRMLFIFAGAFQGLERQISAKQKKVVVGFGADINSNDNTSEDVFVTATMEDIANYGFNKELLGRIGTMHYLPPFGKSDYYELLCGRGVSVKNQYSALYDVSGVKFDITDAACDTIAELACERKSGARALSAILQEALTESFGVIDSDDTVTEVRLDSKEGSLYIDYSSDGTRTHAPWHRSESEVKIERDYNFSRDIRREEDITRYCNMLIKYACVLQKEHILPLYYFLQTAIRYMQLEINAEEQSLSSLSKLAKSAVSDIPEESRFHDIVVNRYVRSSDSTSHITMFGFLSLFEGASDSDTAGRIVRQISRIRRNYPLSDKLAG